MRAFALLLVAVNLALFAWITYFAPPEAASDPRPLARQIDPEKIRILIGPEYAVADPARPSLAAQPVPAACLEWGSFAAADIAAPEQALAPLALGARLTQKRSEETAGWWVFMPPQGSRDAAQKKTAELKARGVAEYFVVQEPGRWRWAISLGVFSTEEAAKSRLEALRARDVRTAQMGARDSPVARVWFQMRGADAAQQTRFRELAAGFAGTEVRECS